MTRAKTRDCGGRGGCGSDDQVALDARQRRCKMQETAEISNPPTPNQETRGGENTARGTPPTQKKEEIATRPRKGTETTQQTDQDQDQVPPPRPPTPTRQERENTKPKTSDDDAKKKKKKTQVRERCLGECEEEDVRVEGGERVQDVETQGEPQTTRVWGSPAPEREKREKTSPTKRTRQQKKKDANKHLKRVGS